MMGIKLCRCKTVLATERGTSGFLGKMPCHSSMLSPPQELLTKAGLSNSIIFYAVQPPDKKELWYQAQTGFQDFHEVHLVMCELDHLQRIPLAPFCRVVKREGQLYWLFELSSLPGWAVGQRKQMVSGVSGLLCGWPELKRQREVLLHTSINANKGNLCLNKMFSPPTPCIF